MTLATISFREPMTKNTLLALAAILALTAQGYAQSQGGGITPPMLDNSQASGSATNIITGDSGKSSGTPAAGQVAAPTTPASPKVATSAPASTVPGSSLRPIGDWALECLDATVGGIKCQLLQKVVSAQGQAILAVAIVADPKSKTTNLQIAVPLGVSLSAGSQLMVGSDYQGSIHIDSCSQRGCIIEGVASDALLTAMKKEKAATVIVFNEASKQIPIRFSLMGFTEGYDAMIEANTPS